LIFHTLTTPDKGLKPLAPHDPLGLKPLAPHDPLTVESGFQAK
jgi:hypothetical protein